LGDLQEQKFNNVPSQDTVLHTALQKLTNQNASSVNPSSTVFSQAKVSSSKRLGRGNDQMVGPSVKLSHHFDLPLEGGAGTAPP